MASGTQSLIDDRISGLILSLYRGASDQAAWSASIDELADVAQARWALMSVVNLKEQSFEQLGWHGACGDTGFAVGIEEFSKGHSPTDPTVAWAAAHPKARFCDSRDAVGYSDYLSHEFIRWDRTRFGTTHWLSGYTSPEAGFCFSLSIHPQEGPVDEAQARLFRMLFEHAANAVTLALRSPWTVETSEPCFLLNAAGHVIWQNEPAEAELRVGTVITRHGRLLIPRGQRESEAFERAIAAAACAEQHGSAGEIIPLRDPDGEGGVFAVVRPAPHAGAILECLQPRVLVRLIRPRFVSEDGEGRWRRAFKLTAAEARLAGHLLSGDKSLKEAAAQLGVSYATARVHLARIFDKTGVRSQSALLQLLTRL